MTKKEEFELVLAEYSALRQEILKRMENRYQIISLTLVITGSLLTFGLQPTAPASVLFIQPILGALLTIIWAHNLRGSKRISVFISEQIESRFSNFGWERLPHGDPNLSAWLSIIVGSGGVFLVTEIITLVLGLLKSTFNITDIVLIVFDFFALILSILAIRSTREKAQKRRTISR